MSDVLQRVIAQQRRKEALRFHSQESADKVLEAHDAQVISSSDAGHTFSLTAPAAPSHAPQTGNDLTQITENSDELLSTRDWATKLDERAAKGARNEADLQVPPLKPH